MQIDSLRNVSKNIPSKSELLEVFSYLDEGKNGLVSA